MKITQKLTTRKLSFLPSLTLALILSACASSTPESDGSAILGAYDQAAPLKDQVAFATKGMVSTAHPLATKAGNMMLEKGGSAADAAAAIGFALSVVEPSMSGIGGRSQILVRDSDGTIIGYDAMTQLGENYVQPDEALNGGYKVIGIPGVPAGLLKLHSEHGKLPLTTVMGPAIKYAEAGHMLMPGEVSRREMGKEAIVTSPVLSELFLESDGTLYDVGDLFQQKAQANTLRKISEGGHDAFYKGDIARTIVKHLSAKGSSLTYNDFANYKVVDARIPHTTYRGFEVWGVDAPGNGTSIIESFNILSNFDVGALDEASWAILMSQATAAAMVDTLADSKGKFMERNISSSWAKKRADEITLPKNLTASYSKLNQRPKVTMVAHLDKTQVDWTGETIGPDSHHTTHYVSADNTGMVVSVTQTLGPNMGSKIMTKELGFLYAQTGGRPKSRGLQSGGDRPRTNIAPTIITKDGKFFMAVGAAGGIRIPTAIVEVISRVIDQGMSLDNAVAAPRSAPRMRRTPKMHFPKDQIQLEATPTNGWSSEVIRAIRSTGITVDTLPHYSVFGRVNALLWDEKKQMFIGAADFDWEGSSAGPQEK